VKLQLQLEDSEKIEEKVKIYPYLSDTSLQTYWKQLTEDLYKIIGETGPKISVEEFRETIEKIQKLLLSIDKITPPDTISTVEPIISSIEVIKEMLFSSRQPPIIFKRIGPPRLGEIMRTIPSTLKLPSAYPPNAYFYYFTDIMYQDERSKYRRLDEALTLMGRYRLDLEVVMFVRSLLPPKVWEILTKKLGVIRYPALITSKESLEVDKINLYGDEYTPPNVTVVKIEAGLILDNILQDRDKLFNFLEELYEATKEGIAEESLRKRKIIEVLKMTGKEIKELILRLSR